MEEHTIVIYYEGEYTPHYQNPEVQVGSISIFYTNQMFKTIEDVVDAYKNGELDKDTIKIIVIGEYKPYRKLSREARIQKKIEKLNKVLENRPNISYICLPDDGDAYETTLDDVVSSIE